MSETVRAAIVREAREWIGTPFVHQGRLKGVGADCGGLILGVGKTLAIIDYDAAPTYGRRPSGNEMQRLCDLYLEKRPYTDRRAGNILLMAFGPREAQHLAILTGEQSIVHVLAQVRKCCEHRLDKNWQMYVTGVYSYRGVDPQAQA